MIHRAVPLISAILLAACAGETHHISFEVEPGDHAVVRVYGHRPRIQVTNEGPGAVDLVFECDEGATVESDRLSVGYTERKLYGPVVIRVATGARETARMTVSARGSKGLGLDRRPSAGER